GQHRSLGGRCRDGAPCAPRKGRRSALALVAEADRHRRHGRRLPSAQPPDLRGFRSRSDRPQLRLLDDWRHRHPAG
ncbi:MAG: hypothetical protein AVDCRST_MAG15-140, partial [uncultured Rubellimicrobium sp.]